jgi:mono/diheme cytochrome c family protein
VSPQPRTLILAIAIVVLGLGTIAVLAILHDGLSSRATPTNLEAIMARHARHMAFPSSARTTPNPIASTPETLRDARLHFADHCAVCHANDGGGNTMLGQGLYPKPPDLRLEETQKLSDGELFWIIENGVRFTGMPAFSGHGATDDTWKLVNFIRHLPQLSSEERMEMERFNPKGPDDRTEDQQEDDFLNGNMEPKKAHDDHKTH